MGRKRKAARNFNTSAPEPDDFVIEDPEVFEEDEDESEDAEDTETEDSIETVPAIECTAPAWANRVAKHEAHDNQTFIVKPGTWLARQIRTPEVTRKDLQRRGFAISRLVTLGLLTEAE